MSDNRNESVSDPVMLLHGAFRSGERLPALPSDVAPRSRSEAYSMQERLAQVAGSRTVGWKIAATSDAGQKHINVDGPIGGRILADRVYADGDRISLSGNAMWLAELEFVFVIAETLEPRSAPYSVGEVDDLVSDLHLGIELPSTRYVDPTTVGEAQLIADNACSGDFVFGPQVPDRWRSSDLSTVGVNIEIDGPAGIRTATGVGSNVLGHPKAALVWLLDELSAQHVSIEAGQFVTTGTCCVPVEVSPSDRIVADYDGLGTVRCTFAGDDR